MHCFQQYRGFPILNEHNDKVQSIKNFMATYNIDIFGGCESNANWPLLPDQSRLSQWFRDVNQCQMYSAHNIYKHYGWQQYRGTFWICAGRSLHHLAPSEKDPSGLGHWAVCTLQGRLGHHICIIFGYCPCSNSATCLCSIYMQHQCYFNEIQCTRCPREAFLEDLFTAIQSWHTEGDSILLLADMNDDIQCSKISSFASECNLHKLILSKSPHILPPATFCQGDQFGKSPIDGAWATLDLIISQSMYCMVNHSLGDHRAIILDINLPALIGETKFQVVCPPDCWQNCALPTVKQKYLWLLEEFTISCHLNAKLKSLFQKASTPNMPCPQLQTTAKQFDQLKTEGMWFAEKQCHRLHMGKGQFSLELNCWCQFHDLWRMVLKCKQGCCIKATTIWKLAKKCQVHNPLAATEQEALLQYYHMKSNYYTLKPQHELLRMDFLTLCLQDPLLSHTHHNAIAKIVQLEHQWDTFQRIRHLKQPNRANSISQVEIDTVSGTHKFSTKDLVETALCQAKKMLYKSSWIPLSPPSAVAASWPLLLQPSSPSHTWGNLCLPPWHRWVYPTIYSSTLISWYRIQIKLSFSVFMPRRLHSSLAQG